MEYIEVEGLKYKVLKIEPSGFSKGYVKPEGCWCPNCRSMDGLKELF